MKPSQSSRTAEYNALFRALDGLGPHTPQLVSDDLARHFLSLPLSGVAGAAELPLMGSMITRTIDRRWPGVRTSVIARTHLIDGLTADAVTRSAEQVLLLGAGFDTRAYRLDALSTVPVFEVDHPATQTAKRSALSHALRVLPSNVQFAAIDFELDDLDTALAQTGFDHTRPTLVLWEGVTGYLSERAVHETLAWCGSLHAGSETVFTYLHADVLTDPDQFAGTDRLTSTLAASSEPLTFGMLPDEVPSRLAELGLELQSDMGAADYRRDQYGPAAAEMRGHEFYRVAHAIV